MERNEIINGQNNQWNNMKYILQKKWLQWPHPGAKGSPNPGAKGTCNLMQCPRAPDGIYSVSVSLSEYCVTWSS